MIGNIRGEIILKKEKYLIVDTAGVGYKINISVDTNTRTGGIGESVSLFIHTTVKEDAIELFGFVTLEELEFFELLINISGVGPRTALSILGITTVETLKRAIGTNDTRYLTSVSGIGKKIAEKIVMELRDKVKNEEGDTILQEEMDALEALKTLGYSQNEAREVLKNVDKNINTNQRIKEALKILGSGAKRK